MPARLLSPLFRSPLQPLILAALSLGAACAMPLRAAEPEGGQRLPAQTPVLAVVQVPKPWYAPRRLVVARMRDTLAQYTALPGLAFKAYAIGQTDGSFGGLYLWKDIASARAWFSPAWFERVQRERGVAGRVRFLQVVSVADTVPGGTPADSDSPSVATLLLAASGQGAPSTPITEAMVNADRRVPGLLRRYRVVDEAGRSGVMSLWRDAAAARQQLDAHEQAAAEWFDTPILLPSTQGGNQPRLPGLEGAAP